MTSWTNFIASNDGVKEPPFTGNIISLAAGNFNDFPKTIWAVEKGESSNRIWRWDYNKSMKLTYAQVGGDLDQIAVRFTLESEVFAP